MNEPFKNKLLFYIFIIAIAVKNGERKILAALEKFKILTQPKQISSLAFNLNSK
jgi:hypothetical protein